MIHLQHGPFLSYGSQTCNIIKALHFNKFSLAIYRKQCHYLLTSCMMETILHNVFMGFQYTKDMETGVSFRKPLLIRINLLMPSEICSRRL